MFWHPNVYVYLKSFEFCFGVSLLLIQEKCKGVAKTKVQEKNVGINAFDFSDISRDFLGRPSSAGSLRLGPVMPLMCPGQNLGENQVPKLPEAPRIYYLEITFD